MKYTGFTLEFLLHCVGQFWSKKSNGLKQWEAEAAFKLFDKKDRGFIFENELKSVLADQLECAVSDQDIKDIMQECGDKDNGHSIAKSEFMKFYMQ